MDGYIKIFRKFTEWEWYQDTKTKSVFLHLLLTASFRDNKFRGEPIQRGEVVTSIAKLSNDLCMSQQEVRTALKHLQKTQEINIRSTSKYTVITIRKYSVYQGAEEGDQQAYQQATNKQVTSDQQATNKQVTTLEEGKKVRKKEGKKVNREGGDPLPSSQTKKAQEIVSLYNSICTSFPRCTKLSESRKRAVLARLNSGVTSADFQAVFEKAQRSDFLRGKNARNWSANFDWMVKDSNLAKILDGNYDNKPDNTGTFGGTPPSYDLEELAQRGLHVPDV